MNYTTLRILRAAGACQSGYRQLRASLPSPIGQDEPVPLAHILCSNGLRDTLWALDRVHPSCVDERDVIARLFACSCAESVLPIFERAFPGDQRPRHAIAVSRRFALGRATDEELRAVRAAAWAALEAASGATRAAGAAAWAALEAASGATRAAWAAASDAAFYDAVDAASDATRAAWAATGAAQSDILSRLLTRGHEG